MSTESHDPTTCHGYAASDAASLLQPWSFTRRALREDDVRIAIRYCGVCHSDLHQARNDESTFGGYYPHIVVREEFVLRLPAGLDPARAAPLLCAGITTYSPLRHWRIGPGSRVAIAGLGGLGHMGVKLAHGMGAEVTVVTRSDAKAAEARSLGADHVLVSSGTDAMRAATGRFDLVLDTIPIVHAVDPYLRLVRPDGAMVLVGVIDAIPEFSSRLLIGGRKSLSGSMIGGIAETRELLDLCAEKGIVADCEMTSIQAINEAFGRMERGDVRYRFVIDLRSLGQGTPAD